MNDSEAEFHSSDEDDNNGFENGYYFDAVEQENLDKRQGCKWDGTDWDNKIIIFMGWDRGSWDGTGTSICGQGWAASARVTGRHAPAACEVSVCV